jgi:hypothetical protein
MKIKLLCIIVVFFMIAGGNTSVLAQNKVKSTNEVDDKKNDIIHITDHKSFEVTFNDDQFYGWLKKQIPKRRYLQSSLEIENLQYSSEWNRRVGNPEFDSNLYVEQIDYQIKPKKHYGIDVNYKLFMYFKFFEEKYEKLLTRG